MRSIWQTLDRTLARDIGLVCLADTIVGVSFGAIAVSSGLPIWLPMLLSVVVFAGAAQFMFVGIIASGGNPIAAVLAGLLVNARHVPFGFAVGDVLGRRWASRIVGSHLMIDETVAFALAQEEVARRRAAYWVCGAGLFVCWNVGVAIGGVGGAAISDPAVFGLDAAFPAVLLALVLPSLRDRAVRRATLVGVAIALATAPFLPAGLPVLLALAGVLAGLGPTKPSEPTEPTEPTTPGRDDTGPGREREAAC
ncbi:4-azaleucine resistance probable transporter AzlC [Amycolatopsis arida]|uniref:4-azaleucine resistance probable transporter AzlC n=1 Tax=Amycolatopsis arida TaxID=587909 RepID=A0A1I5Z5V8_9PSEU|nr:AzlC family ABC transporter permease [Amycolatopsis arida]TDX90168.1 4-azaleucine resistance transporter AzlC [Amycolatopsis arida]SFQ51859.1 4-azaleucine resistance probable transporter AzlC [Amycolatopsis arida]